MATIVQLARAMSHAFEGATRANGREYRKLKDDSPDWMTDVIRAAHDDAGIQPDDWRYAMTEEACDKIADLEDDDDPREDDEARAEFADDVPAHNGRRSAWLASHLARASYVNEAISEFGVDTSDPDIFQLIGMGIYREREEVWTQLCEALAAIATDDEDEVEVEVEDETD